MERNWIFWKVGRSALRRCAVKAAVIHHQLAINLAGIFFQVAGITQGRTGTKPQPLKLCELPINWAARAAMPEHGEHVMGFTDVKTVVIHHETKMVSQVFSPLKRCQISSA
ncbi:MAG: hypothetical protein DWQ49_10870 [Bacteroidetes bacterium]|nr:MAG: hypothetical protein DWQ49_10870 [Bacteroidota bacterium]